MPLIHTLMKDTSYKPADLDAVSVASGPGSFTGLRIGVSTARAMAQGLNIPAVGINTLMALANIFPVPKVLICPIMDARKQQVYTAVYQYPSVSQFTPPLPKPLLSPTAIAIDELLNFLMKFSEPVLFPGDGLPVYQNIIQKALEERYYPLPCSHTFQRSSLVAWCAWKKIVSGETPTSYLELKPEYLRASEAERKRNNTQPGNK